MTSQMPRKKGGLHRQINSWPFSKRSIYTESRSIIFSYIPIERKTDGPGKKLVVCCACYPETWSLLSETWNLLSRDMEPVVQRHGACCPEIWSLLSRDMEPVVLKTWSLLSRDMEPVVRHEACCPETWSLLSRDMEPVVQGHGACCPQTWSLLSRNMEPVV